MARHVSLIALIVALLALAIPDPGPGNGTSLLMRQAAAGYSSTSGYGSTTQKVYRVGAYDDYFAPRVVNVTVGATVLWVNGGRRVHTVTSDEGLFDSGDLDPAGFGFYVTFTRPGMYRYHCHHHGKAGMRGMIFVGYGDKYVGPPRMSGD